MMHSKKLFKIDGQSERLLQETHSVLDSNGKETERRIFDHQGQLKLQTIFIYDSNGFLTKTMTKNAQGRLLSSVTLWYDGHNHLIRRSFFDRDQILIAQHLWEYDPSKPERLLKYSKFGKDNTPLLVKKYSYDANGNPIKEEHFQPEGQLSVLKLKTFDAHNREQSETILEKGTIFKARKLVLYNRQNLPVEISWYDSHETIQRLECLDYNENGTLLNEVILDFLGNRSFFKHYNASGQLEYLLRKYNRQPVSEEFFEYDAQQRLILRQRFAIQEKQKILIETERHSYEPEKQPPLI